MNTKDGHKYSLKGQFGKKCNTTQCSYSFVKRPQNAFFLITVVKDSHLLANMLDYFKFIYEPTFWSDKPVCSFLKVMSAWLLRFIFFGFYLTWMLFFLNFTLLYFQFLLQVKWTNWCCVLLMCFPFVFVDNSWIQMFISIETFRQETYWKLRLYVKNFISIENVLQSKLEFR